MATGSEDKIFIFMSSDGDNKNKTVFFFRIGWAAGAECAPSENIQNAWKGVARLTVTAQHALHLAEARSFSALGRHRFLTHKSFSCTADAP